MQIPTRVFADCVCVTGLIDASTAFLSRGWVYVGDPLMKSFFIKILSRPVKRLIKASYQYVYFLTKLVFHRRVSFITEGKVLAYNPLFPIDHFFPRASFQWVTHQSGVHLRRGYSSDRPQSVVTFNGRL